MGRKKTWTEQEETRLLELKAEGKSNLELADMLGRTIGAISGKLNELHESRQKVAVRWSNEEVERLKRLRSEGKTVVEIALDMGRSPVSVEHKLYRLGQTPRKLSKRETEAVEKKVEAIRKSEVNSVGGWDGKKVEALRIMAHAGKTVTEMSKALGFNRRMIFDKLHSLGITVSGADRDEQVNLEIMKRKGNDYMDTQEKKYTLEVTKNEPATVATATSSDVKKSYEENPQINFNTNSAEKQAEKQIKAVINPVKAAVMLEGFLTDWLGDEAEAVGLCANAKWCDIRFKHSGQVYSLSFSFIEEEKTNG